jgi:hypothetical protein
LWLCAATKQNGRWWRSDRPGLIQLRAKSGIATYSKVGAFYIACIGLFATVDIRAERQIAGASKSLYHPAKLQKCQALCCGVILVSLNATLGEHIIAYFRHMRYECSNDDDCR